MATSAFHSSLTLSQSPPHPLILEPPLEEKQVYSVGDKIKFKIVLIGKAIDCLTYLLLAVQRMGQIGVGRRKGKFCLERMEAIKEDEREIIYSARELLLSIAVPRTTWPDIIGQRKSASDAERVTLNFITPLRFQQNGALVRSGGLEFPLLFNNLLTRLSRLVRYYCGETERLNFDELSGAAQGVTIADSHLRWYDWERYSSKQKTKMKLGGLVGDITFEGKLNPFLPYLILGSYIHVGKNTVFGLGKYEVIIDGFEKEGNNL